MSATRSAQDERRAALAADCANCAGLCCVALAFTRSADFAADKPAGEPCANLRHDFRCGIHDRLRDRGFRGCTVFDCFGAGQKVTQVTFAGANWRDAPESGALMFAVFPKMRDLHELLWYLNEAMALPRAEPMHAELAGLFAETEELTREPVATIAGLDVAAHRSRVAGALARASELARSGAREGAGPSKKARRARPGADLIGADLTGTDLRGASLRGALLIAADLSGADLTRADLTGADLRDANLRGADLSGALFLTQSQLTAANGDGGTRIPARLDRPAHWAG